MIPSLNIVEWKEALSTSSEAHILAVRKQAGRMDGE